MEYRFDRREILDEFRRKRIGLVIFGVFEPGDGTEKFFLRFGEFFFRKVGFAQQFFRFGLGTLGPFAVNLMQELSGLS